MTGIQYIVDEKGKKTSVVIDLQEHGDLWEDFMDRMRVESRRNEPRESLADVKKKLQQKRRRKLH